MRNLLEYPVTSEEVIRYLIQPREQLMNEDHGMVGDMRPLFLTHAIDVILARGDEA